jgi:hypothetical protein
MKLISEMTTAELVAEYNEKTGKNIKKFSSRAAGEKQVATLRDHKRSISTSETWNNKEIAAKRAERHNVNVTFNNLQAATFRSVKEAFVFLGLPIGKHIPFRMALKKENSKTFEHEGTVYTFSVASK